VTYYFTQKILAPYSETEKEVVDEDKCSKEEEVASFVQKYGAYLQIHSCLSYSAAVKAETAISELLVVASHDPSHRDAVKEIQRGKTLIFYDTVSHFYGLTSVRAVIRSLLTIRRTSYPRSFDF
jgi:hypothetical protein